VGGNIAKLSNRVEICGGIASGKTTLCRLLQRAGLEAIFEEFHANPFWRLFYDNPSRYAFETEVTFILQHYSGVKSAAHQRIACDFSFLQDRAYAEINLADGQLSAFMAVYNQVIEELSAPSIIIHLECGAEEEMRRIRHRGRSGERRIELGYLNSVNVAVARSVNIIKNETSVLSIDSEKNDFAKDRAVQRRVVAHVRGTLGW
jgi:deoxyguanosine kinase